MKRIVALILILSLCMAAPCALAEESAQARTSLSGISRAGRNNLELAASSISGVFISYGDSFSFNDIVGPRSSSYGYETARNGRGAKVTGGGVAQAASTLYLALENMGADVEYTDFNTYGSSFVQDYVDSGDEAIMVDYSAGHDFSFVNYEDDMYIEMWLTEKYLYCSIDLESPAASDSFLNWNPSGSSSRKPISSARIWIDGSDSLHNNIVSAASSINDTVLCEGDLFSFNDSVGPRSERYGYEIAVNGRGVEVVGGGVAQVASVIWLAVKNMDDIAIVEKSTYGKRYNQAYVTNSNDAILIDYGNDTDFSFRNTGDASIRISTYVTGDTLYCEIYELN